MINVHSYESQWEHSTGRVSGSSFSFKGVTFRCLYCANPDTIEAKGGTATDPDGNSSQMAVSQKAFFGKKGRYHLFRRRAYFSSKIAYPTF